MNQKTKTRKMFQSVKQDPSENIVKKSGVPYTYKL